MLIKTILVLALSYLIGSIPSGLIIGKTIYKIDLREYGSGNIGATNAYRNISPLAGIIIFISDVTKGAIPVLLAKWVIGGDIIPLAAGMFTIIGNIWSIYLKFHGGKGISTTTGILIALLPKVILILTIIWAIILIITRYVSLASIMVALLFPVMILYFKYPLPYTIFSFIVMLIVLYRHRSNFKRLIEGKELRLGDRLKGSKKN
ncbi:MAG: glycerol-3-phosphate 1-O-acyltransferase PlsY [Actinobacteria bacterium]|nr:glycerol-3-phosphate 1-O-acyltransferase PlsY [Actinomycetota bacterium]